MKQNDWTQQLYDKLAEHETAAPEGLWADIEATLAQQPQRQPQRSRFVNWRRWGIAASLTALLLGGAYLWWNSAPAVTQTAEVAELAGAAGEAESSGATESTGWTGSTESSESSGEAVAMVSAPSVVPAAPTLPEIPEVPEVPEAPASSTLPEAPEVPVDSEAPASPVAPASSVAPASPVRPVPPASRPLTPALYAMNSFSGQTSISGVRMAESMVRQFTETYNNSSAASARSSEPVYLSGFETRQHHHQPVVVGLSLSYPLTERLSLNVGVAYTKLSSEFTQNMRGRLIEQQQTLNYVGLPVGMNYSVWQYRGLKTYLAAGVKADWCVATHMETEGVSQSLSRDRMQWSLSGGVGLEYAVVPQLGLYVEPGLTWYPDNGSRLQNYFKDKPLNYSLQLGLRLNMNNH